MESKKLYKISEVAEVCQVTPRTIRYYEQENLLSDVVRTAGGMRLFTEKDVETIKKIKHLQKEKYLSLEQIKKLIKTESPDYTDTTERIAVVTDSTASLPQIVLDDYDIFVVPIPIHINDKVYADGVNINPIEFYKIVNTESADIWTTPPAVEELAATYRNLLQKGYSRILSIHFAQRWGKTFEAAQQAAEQVDPTRIEVLDSYNTGLGLGLLVYDAAAMAKDKKKFSYIVSEIKDKRKRCWSGLYINSLELFTKGMDKHTIKGEMLDVLLDYKPVLLYNPLHGKLNVVDRVTTSEEALKRLMKIIRDYEKEYGRIFHYVGLNHSYLYSEAYELMKMIKQVYPHVQVIISEMATTLNVTLGFYSIIMSIC